MSTGTSTTLLRGKPATPVDVFGFVKRYLFSIVVCGLFFCSMNAPPALLAEHSTYDGAGILKIKPVSRTHLIELSLTGSRQVGLASVLNNVMEAFLAKTLRAADFFFRLEIPALAPVLNWGGSKEKDVVTTLLHKLQKIIICRVAKKREKDALQQGGNTP